jgi:hypothetical protein
LEKQNKELRAKLVELETAQRAETTTAPSERKNNNVKVKQ